MFPLTLAFMVRTNWRGIPLTSNYCGWHSCQASFQFCLSQMLGVFDKCVKILVYSYTAFPWFVHEKYNFVKHKSNISLITNFCGWHNMYHTYQTHNLYWKRSEWYMPCATPLLQWQTRNKRGLFWLCQPQKLACYTKFFKICSQRKNPNQIHQSIFE